MRRFKQQSIAIKVHPSFYHALEDKRKTLEKDTGLKWTHSKVTDLIAQRPLRLPSVEGVYDNAFNSKKRRRY